MSEGEFARAYEAGRIDERLREHDRRLLVINGSIVSNTRELAALTLEIQRLGDSMRANLKTVESTATAVEKERKSKAEALVSERDASEQRWSPMAKVIAVVLALAAVATVAITIYNLAHGGAHK
jgi:hypothetical protein